MSDQYVTKQPAQWGRGPRPLLRVLRETSSRVYVEVVSGECYLHGRQGAKYIHAHETVRLSHPDKLEVYQKAVDRMAERKAKADEDHRNLRAIIQHDFQTETKDL